MICSICGGDMIWQCDYDYEDFGCDGEGIVSIWDCPKCGTEVLFYIPSNVDAKPDELVLEESDGKEM